MVLAPEHVINEGDVEIKFAGELRLKLSCLEFDNHVSVLVHVEEQHVDVVIVDVEVDVPPNECESWSQFAQGFGDSTGQSQFQFAFSDFPDKPRNSKL